MGQCSESGVEQIYDIGDIIKAVWTNVNLEAHYLIMEVGLNPYTENRPYYKVLHLESGEIKTLIGYTSKSKRYELVA